MVTIDTTTYHAFQKLIEFATFIGGLQYTPDVEKKWIPYVIESIKSLNQPDYRCVDISLDIFDYELQNRRVERHGVYWRTWGLYIQKDCIEVVAESNTDGIHPDDIETSHFHMDYSLSLEKKYYRPLTDINYFDPLIEDVKNYKNYITEHLNEVEVGISI